MAKLVFCYTFTDSAKVDPFDVDGWKQIMLDLPEDLPEEQAKVLCIDASMKAGEYLWQQVQALRKKH
jgi:hypothetical protein